VTSLTAHGDLLALTAALVDMPSVSHHEHALADEIAEELASLPHLTIDRVGDNLVARTQLGRPQRLVLAGHTDTVPAAGNEHARIEGDTLWGLGSADMKAGLAVMLALARTVPDPAVDLTFVFYAREEVAAVESGLQEVADARPDLLQGDAAILGEPTDGVIEAGCQGTMHVEVVLTGSRSHTARPWMGRNAIHRAAGVLAALELYDERRPDLAGCEYREALQAVGIEGGVAGNVVPDRVVLNVNHRFAPDRDEHAALEHVREVLAPHLEAGDSVEMVDVAGGAPPGMDHPLLAALAGREGLPVRAKLGWTDVARFAALGVPAVNLGPGDATLAHTPEERVTRDQLDRTWAALHNLVRLGA
jgi:succinyl-diaminopimelate desuccinylase